MNSSTQIKIVTSSTARAVHISTKRDDERIDFPLCGAPGNTPEAARKFRPQIVHDDIDVTCKRCIAIDAARTATVEREQRITDQKKYVRIADITTAREGDEVFQGGEWVRIDSVTPLQHSSSVKIVFTGGGSHCAPAHHFSARRQLAERVSEKSELVQWLIANDTSDRIISAEYPVETLREWRAQIEQQQQQTIAANAAAALDSIASSLDGAELVELDDAAIRAEEDAQIAYEAEQRASMLDFVRTKYGVEAVELIESGWTMDGALAHVEGTCDVTICTHPAHDALQMPNEAEVIARVTGSRAATVTHERRLLSGELVVESVEQWNADETIGEPDELDDQHPTLVIKIAVSGAAMEEDAPHELQKMLDDVLRKIVSEGHESSRLLDTLGNAVGSFSFESMSVDAATKIES